MNWLFVIPTDAGPRPFAVLFSAEACDLVLALIAQASGIVGVCAPFIPGVAS